MHAILVLPFLAWLLSFADGSERHRIGIVLVAAAGYVITGVVVVANVTGIDRGRLSAAMITAFGAGVALLLGTGILAVFAPRRQSH
jgi:hypothetical protein